jgi:flagellar hook protein FlgE
MTSGMFAAASGIRANQTRLNVISNNIANLNTVGFKASGVNFATVYATTISGGTAPTGTLGGTNPRQVGNGVLVNDIPTNFGQGATQFTGRNTDVMINGEGFFAVERLDSTTGAVGTGFYLTRAGNFSLDSQGNLVTAGGNRVRGTSQLSGTSTATLTTVNIPQELIIVKEYDASSPPQMVNIQYAPVGTTTADINAAIQTGATTQSIQPVKLVTFSIGNDGAITATYSNGDRITLRTNTTTVSAIDPTAARREIIHLPAEGGTYSASNSASTDEGQVYQIGAGVLLDGTGAASLEGMQMQIQMATVTNPGGLLYDGSSNFTTSANTGDTTFGVPASENRGSILAGALESSNVDLAGEFSNLIISQRGLEASSRVIRSQSEVLQAIVNIV